MKTDVRGVTDHLLVEFCHPCRATPPHEEDHEDRGDRAEREGDAMPKNKARGGAAVDRPTASGVIAATARSAQYDLSQHLTRSCPPAAHADRHHALGIEARAHDERCDAVLPGLAEQRPHFQQKKRQKASETTSAKSRRARSAAGADMERLIPTWRAVPDPTIDRSRATSRKNRELVLQSLAS